MTVARSTLHDLACSGPTPAEGCVCAPVPSRRPSAVVRHLDAAGEHRKRAEELVHGVEALTSKLSAMPVIPLDLLDRYQRALTVAHVANQQRVSSYSDAALLRLEQDEAER